MKSAEHMQKYLEQGDMEAASALFEQVLASKDAEDQFLLGEQMLQLGFVEEAKQLFEQLLQSFPGEGELSLLLAEALMELGQEEEAMLILSDIDDTDPFYARALLVQADLYQMQGLYEVSEQKLLQAKELVPDEPIILLALGELYLAEGKFLEAIRHYKEVEAKGTDVIAGISIQQRLAEAYSAGGAFEESLPHFERALEEQVDADTLFQYGFTAFQAGHYVTAAAKLSEVAELDPDYHAVYLHLARAYEQEEALEEALDAARAGIARDSFQKELYLTAGKVALKMSNTEEAEAHLREALVLDPEYTEAALALNALLKAQEEHEGILEIAAPFLEAGSAEPLIVWDAAKAAAELEEYERAAALYEDIHPMLADNPDFLAEYGYFLLEEGRRDEALRLFEALAAQDPQNEEWMTMLDRLQD